MLTASQVQVYKARFPESSMRLSQGPHFRKGLWALSYVFSFGGAGFAYIYWVVLRRLFRGMDLAKFSLR